MSDASASLSTLIIVIVFRSYAFYILVLLYITCTVYFMKYRFERAGAVFNVDIDYGYAFKI